MLQPWSVDFPARNRANSSHARVDVSGSFVAPLPMAMGLREATIR